MPGVWSLLLLARMTNYGNRLPLQKCSLFTSAKKVVLRACKSCSLICISNSAVLMTELCIPIIVSKTVAQKDAIFLMLDELPVYYNNT